MMGTISKIELKNTSNDEHFQFNPPLCCYKMVVV